MCVCLSVSVRKRMCVFASACVCVCVCVCLCLCLCLCLHALLPAFPYVCKCVDVGNHQKKKKPRDNPPFHTLVRESKQSGVELANTLLVSAILQLLQGRHEPGERHQLCIVQLQQSRGLTFGPMARCC